jgi:hypothetical protein
MTFLPPLCRLIPLLVIGLVLAIPPAAVAADPAATPPPGFTPLFNGRDLEGWFGWGTRDPADLRAMSPEQRADYRRASIEGGLLDGQGDDRGDHVLAHWRVEDGELVNDGKGLYLTTDRDYGDFELLVDWKMLPLGDSGIYLRGIPQVQIWDFTEEAKFPLGADRGSGGLWNNQRPEGKFPLVRMDRPFGEWNTFHIRMIGERVTVVLNGTVVVDDAPLDNYFAARKLGPNSDPATWPATGFFPDPAYPRGPIQLQTHGSEIRWRNIFLREIPADEANRILASRDADGFVELVNGRDLSGWQGAVDSYEIRDGAIVCKPGQGGDLLSREAYDDVVIRTEFRLPEAGNNGIALRTPLGGHSARDGLEIQVLDSDGYNARQAAAGKPGLAPYQFHGSLYHCVGAKHGYLRPAGEWNFQEVTVDGQKIRVVLNGTRILDVDLDALDRSLIEHPPAGLDRRSGHVGLAGHSDPVAFRSFRVKRLTATP